jgi:hypothetical protein
MTLPVIRIAMTMWIMDEQCSLQLINDLKLVSKFNSWYSRLAAIQMLQNFGIFHIFLASNQIKKDIKEIVIQFLTDEQLEVRIFASLTLTGFIHSSFINVDDSIVVKYLRKLRIQFQVLF